MCRGVWVLVHIIMHTRHLNIDDKNAFFFFFFKKINFKLNLNLNLQVKPPEYGWTSCRIARACVDFQQVSTRPADDRRMILTTIKKK